MKEASMVNLKWIAEVLPSGLAYRQTAFGKIE
jgi:hypothetical protein